MAKLDVNDLPLFIFQQDDLLKLDETMERRPTVEQPLHQLHLACPDGLVVTFHPETHYGTDNFYGPLNPQKILIQWHVKTKTFGKVKYI